MSIRANVELDQSDLDSCRSMQLEEWEVLESIYPDCCVSSEISKGSIKLEIPIELGDSRIVAVLDDGSLHPTTSSRKQQEIRGDLASLPPVLLQINLPPSYPIYSPPEIVSLQATHSWIPRLPELQEVLLDMWQSGDGVLYSWIELIRSGEFLQVMELSGGSDDAIHIPHPAPHILLPLLVSHDLSAKSSQFSQNSYTCAVCLTSQKGARCLQLSCSHIFCRSCLEDFWGLCITEGDVGRVGCPDPDCVKEAREAVEDEVMRVVSEEQVRRWRWLRQKCTLERDPSMVHCPMEFCQTPVPKPKSDGDDESGWARLRTCQACDYSFCAFCRRTWHGPLSDCPISATEAFVLEYMELPECGEERPNKKWIEDPTMACPGCQVHVEKSLGCNHMTCAKCKQHFCYRCGEKIQASNPYAHFSTPGLRCFSKLFDITSGEDEWQPMEAFELL
ncbi:hypothetical protein BV22DRAFT_1102654 [Leucogyrophana mollusca]|uniref:Uncharacterized protein n=1 Tax=Leucogyrophana mollusca TaxID=85980 RepID=A0ACB8BW55_9AGAM|nr:hypothetical protein BV22DRAFT_1102654 [Leucogyrophana mollusca]